eukprot:SM000061S19243  [mRNA]  locus=s61:369756:370028:+ [translate_table: standard]
MSTAGMRTTAVTCTHEVRQALHVDFTWEVLTRQPSRSTEEVEGAVVTAVASKSSLDLAHLLNARAPGWVCQVRSATVIHLHRDSPRGAHG